MQKHKGKHILVKAKNSLVEFTPASADSSGGSRTSHLLPLEESALPASDWQEYVGEEDLEVSHQAGNLVTPLHCASSDVWVRDMGHHKVPALSS